MKMKRCGIISCLSCNNLCDKDMNNVHCTLNHKITRYVYECTDNNEFWDYTPISKCINKKPYKPEISHESKKCIIGFAEIYSKRLKIAA